MNKIPSSKISNKTDIVKKNGLFFDNGDNVKEGIIRLTQSKNFIDNQSQSMIISKTSELTIPIDDNFRQQ